MGIKPQCAVTGRLVWCSSVDSMVFYVIQIPNLRGLVLCCSTHLYCLLQSSLLKVDLHVIWLAGCLWCLRFECLVYLVLEGFHPGVS